MNGSNKIFTAEDFARYHAGTMSPAEMHSLERAALEDPFLADALEGYANDPHATEHLAELQTELGERTRRRKAFIAVNRTWLRIAAMLILFAGIGYIFYRVNDNNSEPSGLAKNDIKETPAIPANTVRDTIIPQIDTSKLQASKIDKVEREPRASRKEPVQSPVVIADVKQTEAAEKFYATTVKPTAPVNESVLRDNAAKSEEKITIATEAAQNRNNAQVTDFSKFGPRSTMNNSNAPYDGVQRREVQLNSITAADVQMAKEHKAAVKKENANLKAIEKNKLNKTSAEKDYTAEQSSGRMEPIDSVVFNEYLDKNLKPVKDSITHRAYTGRTLLSFTVNRKGQPENIKVETPLCPACDIQAIRLLEKGPRWIYGGSAKRRTVSVEFEEDTIAADKPE